MVTRLPAVAAGRRGRAAHRVEGEPQVGADRRIVERPAEHPLGPAQPVPHGVPMKLLSNDQKWTDAPELGVLGHVFEQDMDNLPYVQEGLHASKTGEVNLGDYQEIRIRQFHQTLDKYLNA